MSKQWQKNMFVKNGYYAWYANKLGKTCKFR